MDKISTLKLNHMLKKSLISATMLGVVVIALASTGGGKKKSTNPATGIIPISANGTFLLKSKPSYSGSHILSAINLRNTTVYRSVITYQKGNTTFIVPSQYRLNNRQSKLTFNSGLGFRSNLNMVDLKLRLCR
jgi:hypothetical protein